MLQREGEPGEDGAGSAEQQPAPADGLREASADRGVRAARARPREGGEGGCRAGERPGEGRDAEGVSWLIRRD